MFNISNIHSDIEEFVQQHDVDYIDAVLKYCADHDIEIETMGAIIGKDPNFSSKIQNEAENLHFIKKVSRLPI